MLDKLTTKLRHKSRFQQNGYSSLNGISAYPFDNCSVAPSQSSSKFSSETSGQASSADGLTSSYTDFTPYSASSTPDNRAFPEADSSDEVEDLQYLPGYEDAEEKFLEEYEDYFENIYVDNIRKEQYPKLDLQRLVYLDFASSALFSQFQVQKHMQLLLEEGPTSLSNVHSKNLSPYVLDTLQRLLRAFNVSNSDYAVVFTTGFTAGYRLFSEIYTFRKGSTVLTLLDNHESVKHVVSASEQNGAKCVVVPLKETTLSISASGLRKILRRKGLQAEGGSLFVYPAQSCLSGMQHSLNWIAEVQQFGSHVLLDVSTHLPVGSLDLSIYQPEFVLGSLHHMLGYPSGMGFLLVRKKVFSVHKTSSSLQLKGGLVEGNDCHIICEDNNINLLSFAASSFGLQHLKILGLAAIQNRVHSLMTWLTQTLKLLKHKTSGGSLLQLYGSHEVKTRGNIIAFNVMDSTGNSIPAIFVQRLAERNNIIIGAGHFSNPGVATLLRDGKGRTTDASIFRRIVPFSTLRVSLGPVSTFNDVYRLVQFLCRFRDEDHLAYEALDFLEDHP